MDTVTKAVAELKPADDDAETPHGAFEVILSTPTKDRDGEEVGTDEWQQPLPEHITFDNDHGMSVASTVGSGKPRIEDDGSLRVSGTYASTDLAQQTRSLVNDGHIRTVSVAFLRKSAPAKGGKARVTRELLNGAFVAVPANPEALVLSSKAGARNSKTDQSHLQDAHDSTVAAGATCALKSVDLWGKHIQLQEHLADADLKAIDGSFEQRQEAVSAALRSAYPGDQIWAYALATFDDSVVYRVSGGGDSDGQWQASYTFDDGDVTLGTPEKVQLVETVVVTGSAEDQTEDSTGPAASATAPKSAAAAQAAAADPEPDADAAAALEIRARALAVSAQATS